MTVDDKYCEHVYKSMGPGLCPKCGLPTHDIDWKEQNRLHREWLKKNPDAWRTVGWWSI